MNSPYIHPKYACFCFIGQLNCLNSNFKMACSDYMAVHISVQVLSALAESCFQFDPCRFGVSCKSGLIHMDFSPLFWLSPF